MSGWTYCNVTQQLCRDQLQYTSNPHKLSLKVYSYDYRSNTQCSLEQPRALSMMVWSEGVWDAILLNSLSHVSERDSRIPVHITRDLTSGGILQSKKYGIGRKATYIVHFSCNTCIFLFLSKLFACLTWRIKMHNECLIFFYDKEQFLLKGSSSRSRPKKRSWQRTNWLHPSSIGQTAARPGLYSS